VTTTTGGGKATPQVVTTLAELQAAAKGTTAAVIHVKGVLEAGTVSVGSNKTIVGLCGAELHGHIQMSGSVNVILRNLRVVGYNCADVGSGKSCQDGADAITVQGGAHHLWFDHDDILDGSDGNLDFSHAADHVTVSWTRFRYSSARVDVGPDTGVKGHRFSNLIGHSDDNQSEDAGHLRITFHHDWWGPYVLERQPRVRFGQVHLFNNLYSSSPTDYCIGVGVGADIRGENNAFLGVTTPIDTTRFVNASKGTSAISSTGNLYSNTSGDAPADLNAGTVFQPPYPYSAYLTPASQVEAAVKAGAGPK
jgi:pectate lyase